MNARIPLAVVLMTAGAGLAGCVCNTSEQDVGKKEPTETSQAFRPLGASDYWAMREAEDRAAVARAVSEGRGP